MSKLMIDNLLLMLEPERNFIYSATCKLFDKKMMGDDWCQTLPCNKCPFNTTTDNYRNKIELVNIIEKSIKHEPIHISDP